MVKICLYYAHVLILFVKVESEFVEFLHKNNGRFDGYVFDPKSITFFGE